MIKHNYYWQFLGAAMLIIAILAATDKKNIAPPTGLVPLVIFLAFLGIGITLGMDTGYAINPARDLGPRILTAMVGYGKEGLWHRAPLCKAKTGLTFPFSVRLQAPVLALVPHSWIHLRHAMRGAGLRPSHLHWLGQYCQQVVSLRSHTGIFR